MNHFRRGAAAIVALALTLGIACTAAAAGATLESHRFSDRWSVEEPDGTVIWFDVVGQVRVVTAPNGRQSATIHARETQTAYGGGQLRWQSRSVSRMHVLAIGEDLFLVHLGSRGRWSGEIEGSVTLVLHIVKGKVVVDHLS